MRQDRAGHVSIPHLRTTISDHRSLHPAPIQSGSKEHPNPSWERLPTVLLALSWSSHMSRIAIYYIAIVLYSTTIQMTLLGRQSWTAPQFWECHSQMKQLHLAQNSTPSANQVPRVRQEESENKRMWPHLRNAIKPLTPHPLPLESRSVAPLPYPSCPRGQALTKPCLGWMLTTC